MGRIQSKQFDAERLLIHFAIVFAKHPIFLFIKANVSFAYRIKLKSLARVLLISISTSISMFPTESGKPEIQSSSISDKDKSDKVILKDVLKPNSLIIALIACVLFILLGWYVFILEPALRGNNPLDIRLIKKPSSKTAFSPELKYKTKAATQSTDDEFERSNAAALRNEEKPEVVQPNISTRPTASTQRTTSIKSAKPNTAKSKKEPTTQPQESPRLQNEFEGDKKVDDVRVVHMKAEEDKEEAKEDAARKIKSFADKWKESFLTPATQTICTQVQIAMNQCPN